MKFKLQRVNEVSLKWQVLQHTVLKSVFFAF